MPVSRKRKNAGKGAGARERRRRNRQHNEVVRARIRENLGCADDTLVPFLAVMMPGLVRKAGTLR